MIDVEAIYKRALSAADHVAALQAVYAAGLAEGRTQVVKVEAVPPAEQKPAPDEAES